MQASQDVLIGGRDKGEQEGSRVRKIHLLSKGAICLKGRGYWWREGGERGSVGAGERESGCVSERSGDG